jgi:hypothetical protein
MWLKTVTECKLSPSNRGTQLEHKERKQRKIAERNFAATVEKVTCFKDPN